LAVDTSAVGVTTGAWRVVLDRAVLGNFARAVGDTNRVYTDRDAAGDAGFSHVPAPPTFTFAAPYWSAYYSDEQPEDPTRGQGNPMHKIMGELYAKGALVLHGEQEFEYHRTPVAGDVLDGEQKITDIYEKSSDSADMTFIVMETTWRDAANGEPVVTERFNLIARLKK
jgi:acyl dehydratase